MKISFDWLGEYLDLDIPLPQLVETLNRIGLMVESWEETDGDVVLDIETYANRPDTLGHLGMARELAAALGLSLKEENWPLVELGQKTSEVADVQILDEDLCPRYCGLVVRGVKVGPSPHWMKRRIEAMGLNSINNVVDATNYVLFSTAQPIHAFDLAKISGKKIIIRRARKGERLKTLDERDVELHHDMLVIADEKKPVALAGIIGGEESAVSEGTVDIFIESAFFDPVSVRKTRKALGFQTDASYRFERGMDIAFPPRAALMAASLLSQFGGRVALKLTDVYPVPRKKKEVVLRHRRVSELLGIEVEEAFIKNTLEDLEFVLEAGKGGAWRVKIPSFRVDIDREADLIEEIARFFGYENIPSTLAPLKVIEPAPHKARERINKLRQILFQQGFNEALTFSFSNADIENLFNTGFNPVEIRNPISSKASLLRTTLLGGLLEATAWNKNRGMEAVDFFEIGNRYYWVEEECLEKLTLAILSTGASGEIHWSGRKEEADFFRLKGTCEVILSQLRYEPHDFEKEDHPFFEPGFSLALRHKEMKIGYLGLLAERILDGYSLDPPIYAAEIDLDLLFSKQPKAFVYDPVPRFPAVSRDLSFLVSQNISYKEIRRSIEKLSLPFLEDFHLVDLYEGPSLPEDKISLSFRFIFRNSQRTLQAEEVEKAEKQLVSHLQKNFRIQLREGGKIDNGTGKN